MVSLSHTLRFLLTFFLFIHYPFTDGSRVSPRHVIQICFNVFSLSFSHSFLEWIHWTAKLSWLSSWSPYLIASFLFLKLALTNYLNDEMETLKKRGWKFMREGDQKFRCQNWFFTVTPWRATWQCWEIVFKSLKNAIPTKHGLVKVRTSA